MKLSEAKDQTEAEFRHREGIHLQRPIDQQPPTKVIFMAALATLLIIVAVICFMIFILFGLNPLAG